MNSANAQVDWWRPAPPPGAVMVTASGGATQTRLSIWGFRALVAFAAVNITAPQLIFPALAPFRIAFLAGGAALVAYLAEVFTGVAPDTPRPKELTLGALLIGWATLTLPLSSWPTASFLFLTDQFLKSIIIYWLLARVIRTSSQLLIIFWTLTLVSIPLAWTGIAQQRSGEFVAGRITGYASGLTSNPNDLAMMVDLILPLAVTVALLARTRWARWGALLIAGVNLICLGATYSRGGFLGLVVIIGGAVMLVPGRIRWALILAGVLAFPTTIALLPASYVDRLSTIKSVDADETGSSQDRMAAMADAAAYIVRHPMFGAGLSQDNAALAEMQGPRSKWLHVHNAYLAVGMDLGVPGLVMYVAMIYLGYSRIRRVEREARTAGWREMTFMAAGLRLSYLGLVTTQAFSPGAYNFPIFYLLGLVLALDVAHAAGRVPVTAELQRA